MGHPIHSRTSPIFSPRLDRSRCARRHRFTREGEGVMDLILGSQSLLPARLWTAWRTRGTRYAWHKVLRRSLGRWPAWKRRFLYADPRVYWTMRGGQEYFLEQEGQPARSARAVWMADRIAAYRPSSVLEIGCGYGKQLRSLRRL